MNKIATFDLNLGAIAISGDSTSGVIDLATCRNVGRFSVQSIMSAIAAQSALGTAGVTWTEDGSTDGLWARAWAAATLGTPTAVTFNVTHAGTSDSTPDSLYEWYFDSDVLSVFTATGDHDPAAYYTSIAVTVAPTMQIDYLASNDGINYVVGGGGTAIATGVTSGAKLPVAFTPPLCRFLKLKVTEEGAGGIASARLILAVQ